VAEGTAQNAFTILTPLALEGAPLAALEKQLDALDPVLGSDPRIRFREHAELHYCSFVLVRSEQGAYLAFEGNVDGEVEPFLRSFTEKWRPILEEIYRPCQDWNGDLLEYLLRHDVGPGTWYVAFRGRSAVEIQREALLREQIETFLDSRPDLLSRPAAEVRSAIQEQLRADPELAAWAADPPARPFLVRRGRALVLGLAAVAVLGALAALVSWPGWVLGGLAVLLAALVAAALYLRRLERSDRESDVVWDPIVLRDVAAREDVALQNHMCSVTHVKDGRFRALTLRLALGVVGLAHHLWFNRGDLGGIPTIHFARWVITQNGSHLVFFSNFDGSWERYLGDFIDRASIGLNSVWSNTRGYPKTRFLVLGGARDEQRFKTFARNSMQRTRIWYAAYPNLSIQNIEQNARIREDLFRPLGPAECDEWLRRF
jgi:hypothetical protein